MAKADAQYETEAGAIPEKLNQIAQHYRDADSGANRGFQEMRRRLDGGDPTSGLPFRVPR